MLVDLVGGDGGRLIALVKPRDRGGFAATAWPSPTPNPARGAAPGGPLFATALAEADAVDAEVPANLHPHQIGGRLQRRGADLRALAATHHDRKVTAVDGADQERREIRAAMGRLLAGRPLRTPGGTHHRARPGSRRQTARPDPS